MACLKSHSKSVAELGLEAIVGDCKVRVLVAETMTPPLFSLLCFQKPEKAQAHAGASLLLQ